MRAISLVVVVFCSLSLAGSVRAASDSSDSREGPQKATVVVSVSHSDEAGKRMTTSFFIDGKQALESVQRVLSIPTGSDFKDEPGRVYVLDLPPGAHEFTSWEISQGTVKTRPSSTPEPLRFVAREGEVVYLGNLHMDMQITRGGIGNRVVSEAMPTVRNHFSTDVPIATAQRPDIKDKTVPALLPEGPWTHSGASRQVNPIPIVVLPR